MTNATAGPDEPEYVSLQARGRIAHIELRRPETLNAVSVMMERQLREALRRFDTDDELWICIISGAGRAFCAGADRTERLAGATPAERLVTWSHTPPDGFLGRTVHWKPVIAAVHGYCLGLGLRLALECDLVVADQTARFGATETLAGLPGSTIWSGLQVFMPSKIATEMLLTGAMYPAEELHRLGLVNRLTAEGDQLAEAQRLAGEVLAAPPLTVRANVRITRMLSVELAEQALRATNPLRLQLTSDFEEAARAFAEKRPARFTGT